MSETDYKQQTVWSGWTAPDCRIVLWPCLFCFNFGEVSAMSYVIDVVSGRLKCTLASVCLVSWT